MDSQPPVGGRGAGSRTIGRLAVVIVVGLIAAPTAFASPPNDNFANATPIQRIDDQNFTDGITGDNVNASAETGEPNHFDSSGSQAPGDTSVWYSFAPDHTGPATFVACTNVDPTTFPGWVSFDALLGVYTGSAVSSLTSEGTYSSVDCDPSPGSPGTDIQNTFQAVSGTTYQIAVAGMGGLQGNLRVALLQAPANDNFLSATTLTGAQGQKTGDNMAATEQTGEPAHGSGDAAGSVWYRWTAPMAGKATFATCPSHFHFSVYTGSSVGALQRVRTSGSGGCGSSTSFTATQGTTYRIGVDSSFPTDAFTIQFNEVRIPQTTITAGPSGATNDATPTFQFKSSLTGSTFACRIDGQAFGPCSGPGAAHTPGTPLADGQHTFAVRAAKSGATDATPATRTFIVDTHRPQTTITAGPTGVTHDTTPTFKFSSSEAGSTFRCVIRLANGSGASGPCSGPGATHTPSLPLANGNYVFSVRAVDKAGNIDPTPANRSFTVSG